MEKYARESYLIETRQGLLVLSRAKIRYTALEGRFPLSHDYGLWQEVDQAELPGRIKQSAGSGRLVNTTSLECCYVCVL